MNELSIPSNAAAAAARVPGRADDVIDPEGAC
jgi:hypothetical protein